MERKRKERKLLEKVQIEQLIEKGKNQKKMRIKKIIKEKNQILIVSLKVVIAVL